MKSIKRNYLICLTIALLNFFDGMVTHFGLLQNEIEEANPFLSAIWNHNPIFFLFTKVILSFLIILVGIGVKKEIIKQLTFIQPLLLLALATYVYTFFLHIFWISIKIFG